MLLGRHNEMRTPGPGARCFIPINHTSLPPHRTLQVQDAVDYLRSDALILEPRTRWPKPILAALEKAMPDALERFESGKPKVTMPDQLCAQPGRVLCLYGDAGWGQEVARGKYHTGTFSDALVKAAAD